MARLSVAHATDGNISAMTRLARNRLAELVAEKLVAVDSIDDVDKQVGRLASVVADAETARIKTDELGLKRQDLQRRLDESEAKLERARLDLDERKRQLEASINAAKKTVQGAVEGGSKSMDAGDVIAILDRVMKGEAA